jgi:isopentenyl-diphosphate delta-isomerase
MHSQRKSDHLRICLEEETSFKGLTTGLENYRLVHQALPEMSLAEVDLSLTLLGKAMRAPLLISAMTGGTEAAAGLNRHLAQAAQSLGLAMSLGSQRAAIDDARLASTYQVRDVAPDILLLANLGAVQLNYGYGLRECQRAVDMIQADGLILHLNPLQECLQDNGNTNFSGLLTKIEAICQKLPVPVIVKEVGWGISETLARQLVEVGVGAIDVAGAGGTSWSEVEKHRASTEKLRHVAESFAEWGIPTAQSIRMVRQGAPEVTLIASGGIRNGVEAAKAIALGADAAGIATPLLKLAALSAEAVVEHLTGVAQELRIAMFCSGARNLQELRETPIIKI